MDLDLSKLEEVSVSAAREGTMLQVSTEYTPNDSGNAKRFVDSRRDDIRYVPAWGKWLIWNGNRWEVDDTSEHMRIAQRHMHELLIEAAKIDDEYRRGREVKLANSLGNTSKINAMLELAQYDERVVVRPNSF